MKLKEKFKKQLDTATPTLNRPFYQSEKCEAIADEFAIGFAEWFTNEKSKYSVMYGKQEKRFATFTKEYTAKELLEIYKKEKGL